MPWLRRKRSSRDANKGPHPNEGDGTKNQDVALFPSSSDLLSDDPIETETEDVLSRMSFVGATRRLLEDVRSQSKSSVIGFIGAWRSGKTSILHLLRADLSKTWNVLNFNPWFFPDVET